MLKRVLGKEEDVIRLFAKEIVDSIADRRYEEIARNVDDMQNWDVELLREVIESFKEDNELEQIDRFDVECTFRPVYKDGSVYQQESFYHFNDGSGIAYEYALTTDGEPNDLTLSIEFHVEGDDLKVIFESGITVL
ncbi:hypothetical protein SAMN04488688_10392 [Paenibacillus sp. cl141a]|uniref:DUF7668 domain-containing protein n=1 Tax=Paenibacillus sp. cl141a TaxID=1761877 RepID=UPI0008C5E082|nr:hypothetical protein [Paenibacillus sp. cl141a]SEL18830.1 hypothetical protein SAMN04488688_10392 [Paenibacillus sp. cl141a]